MKEFSLLPQMRGSEQPLSIAVEDGEVIHDEGERDHAQAILKQHAIGVYSYEGSAIHPVAK